MKVKIFNCNGGDELEKEINEFLDNNKDIDVIDIKYNTLKGRGVFGDDWYSYSALIMYQYKIVMPVTEIMDDHYRDIVRKQGLEWRHYENII